MNFSNNEHDKKMEDQIEMSTAEKSPKNVFGTFTNYADRQSNLTSTFTFCTPLVQKSPNATWLPFNLSMAKLQHCITSFDGKWPRQMSQRAYQMIASGFYYTGCGDKVTCFYCGITLLNWDRGDDVDVEHKKHSPKCKYLLICRQV